MERDMDLVRQILLTLEKRTDNQNLEIEGYTADQIAFHVWLMDGAGLIKGVNVTMQASNSRAHFRSASPGTATNFCP